MIINNMKANFNFRICLVIALLMLPFINLQAQAVSGAFSAETASGYSLFEIANMSLVGLVLLIIFSMLLYLLYMLCEVKKYVEGKNFEDETPVFQLTNAVPIEREYEIMLDHNYDGIRELDNSLPPWWVAMFYLSIIFGAVYFWYYHIHGDGNVQEQEYLTELVDAESAMRLMANRVDENSVKLITEKDKILSGEAIYAKNCVACHGKLGEGGVGPNLTDAYWLHGGDIKSMFKTIKYGVPAKGMIPWQAQLSPAQIQEVASYIATLRGTNPPNGKEPQGDLIAEKE